MSRNRIFFTICIFIFCISHISGEIDQALHLKILDIEQAVPPEVFADQIIFSYEAKEHVHFVGARFDFEDYKKLHVYSKTYNNIFVLVIPLPAGINTIKYRIVIDGLWSHDPYNPNIIIDEHGIKYSIVNIEKPARISVDNPKLMGQGSVSFAFMTAPGKNIYIAGDFNNWDPFFNKLIEKDPGYYSITLRILPGIYCYYFLVDGKIYLDPYNVTQMSDEEGNPVSCFIMP